MTILKKGKRQIINQKRAKKEKVKERKRNREIKKNV